MPLAFLSSQPEKRYGEDTLRDRKPEFLLPIGWRSRAHISPERGKPDCHPANDGHENYNPQSLPLKRTQPACGTCFCSLDLET